MIDSIISIIVDLSIVLGTINPCIYGQYLEHVEPDEKIIYGGIFDKDSPLSDKYGIRKDVAESLNRMKVPIIRWPGGCFADTYHWKNGIGEIRIGHQNGHWGGWESNLFGTDEYLHLCNLLNTKTYICLNAGTGTAEEAAEWVEYCHGKGINGGVWGIGNEMYGSWEAGSCSAEEYASRIMNFAQEIRDIDQKAKLVAVGSPYMDWNKIILEKTTPIIDYISIHMYAHSFPAEESDYFNVVGAPLRFEESLEEVISLLKKYDPDSRIKIAVDEWNVRHIYGKHIDRKDPRNLQDALFVAGVFNVFQRLCKYVTLANYVFMVNGHAPILVEEDSILESSIYPIFYAYQNFSYKNAVKTSVESPIYNAKIKDIGGWGGEKEISIPLIDASATTDFNGNLSVSVINRSKEEVIINLEILGSQLDKDSKVELWSFSADSPLKTNYWSSPDAIKPILTDIEDVRSVSLKPYSVNFFKMKIK